MANPRTITESVDTLDPGLFEGDPILWHSQGGMKAVLPITTKQQTVSPRVVRQLNKAIALCRVPLTRHGFSKEAYESLIWPPARPD